MTSLGRLSALERMLGNRPHDSRLRFGLARLGSALRDLGCDEEALEAFRTGSEAAMRHGHPPMAEEFSAVVKELNR